MPRIGHEEGGNELRERGREDEEKRRFKERRGMTVWMQLTKLHFLLESETHQVSSSLSL